MADYEDVRRRIVATVFEKRNATLGLEESYVTHIKIWEVEGGVDKPRYILLANSNKGPLIHKSRLNTNGTFSVGKTWNIDELRAVDATSPQEINITFARSYKWLSENQKDEDRFLNTLVRLFRDAMGPGAPLQLSGIDVAESSRSVGLSQADAYTRRGGSPTPTYESNSTVRRAPLNQQSNGITTPQRAASPVSRPRSRTPANGAPAISSAEAPRSRRSSPPRSRPASPSVSQTVYARPPHARQLSNTNTVSSSRSSGSAANTVPSIMIPLISPGPSATRTKETSPLRPKPSQSLSSVGTGPTLEEHSLSSRLGQGSSTTTPTSPLPPEHGINGKSSLVPRSKSPSALSTASRRSQKSRATPSPEPPVPLQPSLSQEKRRDPNARISFFDAANQALLDRLLSTSTAPSASTSRTDAGAQGEAVGGGEETLEEEGDSVQATLTNIEEMLESYEWTSDDLSGLVSRTRRGPIEHIESRLLDELMLLEKANIHSFLESDDRIGKVMKYFDDAIAEFENMESVISSYKIHLNAVCDDIAYIQSQNRGLQVQTQNQKALLTELEKLLQTVHVDRETLLTLTQESLEKTPSIQRLEAAAAELYKALLAGRDSDMAATMERLEEYRTHNAQFCRRLLDFLTIMFTAQSNILLRNSDGLAPDDKGRLTIISHDELEAYLGRYCGLMLYLKEMDEAKYSKVCAAYFSAASELHVKQMKALVAAYGTMIKRVTEEPEQTSTISGLRRAGTVVRSPLDGRKERDKAPNGTLRPSEALSDILEQLGPQVAREEEFIADFLQINDAALTYADYLGLEHYFRRQASQSAGLSTATLKLVRGALDLIFGFLPAELKSFIDGALSKDTMNIVGVLATVERAMMDAEDRGNSFYARLLDKQHQRLKTTFDRHEDEHIKEIEQTKLNAKKRRGIAPFIRSFPSYVNQIEEQLIGADDLEIRGNVDAAYERIVQAMFACLRQMAKMDGEQGEDKGQLNYHVILIENMHHFVAEIGKLRVNAAKSFGKRAQIIYEENLNAYVKMVLRRPFGRIIDYFEGIERLLKSSDASEVSKNSSYNRSALKRVVKEHNAKDVRKHIDTLFRRVEKHFTEASDGTTTESSGQIAPETVLVGVWKACEDELLRITELFNKRISQCYADVGVTLEYNASDVDAAFKRHRAGS